MTGCRFCRVRVLHLQAWKKGFWDDNERLGRRHLKDILLSVRNLDRQFSTANVESVSPDHQQ